MTTHAFQALVQETLDYIKTQSPRGWVFGAPEEVAFFRKYSSQSPSHSEPQKAASLHVRVTLPQNVGKKSEEPLEHRPEIAIKIEPVPESKEKSQPKHPSPAKSDEIRQTLQKIAPMLSLSEEIPDDKMAKRIASAWKEKLPDTPIVLLVLNFLPETIELMKNLAKAMQKEFGTIKLITGDRLEQEKRWDLFFEQNRFQLIVASAGIEQYPELLKYYKMIPANQTAFLGETPLVTLEAALAYKHSAEKKLELWKSLCLMLKK